MRLKSESRPCVNPTIRPDPAGSPFNLDQLKDFIGVDITPACRRITELTFYVWGKRTVLPMAEAFDGYMVERSARETSLDFLLTEEALDAGVRIEYGRELCGSEFSNLPANSIITTGLEADAYRSMGLSLVKLYGAYARGTCDMDEPTTAGYFDSYTKEYGFTSSINKRCFAFLISKPEYGTQAGLERFKQQVADTAPFELGPWQTLEWGAIPHASMFAPRLFWGDKILAGTVAGIMDPTMYYGMLGALVSGKVAATAVTDPEKAQRQFKQVTKTYTPSWLIKRGHDLLPDAIRRPFMQWGIGALENRSDAFWNRLWSIVPGYGVFG